MHALNQDKLFGRNKRAEAAEEPLLARHRSAQPPDTAAQQLVLLPSVKVCFSPCLTIGEDERKTTACVRFACSRGTNQGRLEETNQCGAHAMTTVADSHMKSRLQGEMRCPIQNLVEYSGLAIYIVFLLSLQAAAAKRPILSYSQLHKTSFFNLSINHHGLRQFQARALLR